MVRNKFAISVITLAISLATTTTVSGVTSLSADDERPIVKPVTLMMQLHDPAITHGRSMVWDQDVTDAVSHFGTMVKPNPSVMSFEPNGVCTSFQDAVCSASSNATMTANSVLGLCESSAELGCIESVSYSANGITMAPLSLVSGGTTVFPEEASMNIARGASLGVWQASNGLNFVVSAVLRSGLSKSSIPSWNKATAGSLNIAISRVPVGTVLTAATANVIDSPSNPGSKTFAYAHSAPANTIEFAAGTRFVLKIRVPNTVTSWFQGRLANTVIGATPLSGERTAYEISGDASPVHIAGAEARADDPNIPSYPTPIPAGTFIRGLGSPSNIWDFEKWKRFMNDKAITSIHEWAISALGTAQNSCFDSSKGIVGFASTNAGFYSATPPTLNTATGVIEYKVASPHFASNGQIAKGSYSLSLPLSVLQCLYRTDVEPTEADMTLTYEDGTKPYSVTQTVTKKDGWLNVTVDGFHFSSPTIGTKFLVKSPTTTPAVVPVPPASVVPSAKPTLATLKKGKSKTLSSIAKPKASQRPKWTASGACRISGTRVVASKKSGTCKVTVRVLNTKKKYVVLKTVSYKVS
jgi:hypothetical protein